MNTAKLSHAPWKLERLAAASVALLFSGGLTTAVEGKGKPLKSAPIAVTLDATHVLDPLTTNGLTTDGGTTVQDGIDGTSAIVGSSFDLIVDLRSGSRALELDLSQPLGAASTGIDLPADLNPPFPDIECGRVDFGDSFSTSLLNGGWTFSDAEFRVRGRDMLKLALGASSPVNADLEFYDAGGNRWQLRWGPFEHAGSGITYNPGSDPVILTRVDASTWTFHTTGDHHAALYRYGSPSQTSSQVYYGQFVLPFSGTAAALQNLKAPSPSINEIPVLLTPPGVIIVSPAGNQMLPVNSELTFSGAAFDHCLDISEEISWTIDGQQVVTGSSWITTFTQEGVYEVVATAVNRAGATASDQVQITIGDPTPSATMSVGSITHKFRKGGRDLRIQVSIVSSTGASVSGAQVAIEVSGPSGLVPTSPVLTGSDGVATFQLGNVASGSYTATVADVSHADFIWDGEAASTTFTR